MMEMFGRAWRREEKLWKVYWILGWVIPIIFGIVVDVFEAFIPPAKWLQIVSLPYTIWWMIATWRCAWNCVWKGWGYIARGLVVILPIVGLLVGGVLAGQDLIKAAECRAAMTQMAENSGMAPKEYMMAHASEHELCTKEGIQSMGWVIERDASGNVVHNTGAVSLQPPAVSTPVTVSTIDACEQKMTDFAVQNKVDPKAYIEQNQAYLAQCRVALTQPVKLQ